MFIYKITNKVNGKSYVGQTVNEVKERWKAHCRPSSCKDGSQISFAIQKYGKDNFTFEVIDTALAMDELNTKEITWIQSLNTLSPYGYNLSSGGLNARKHQTTKDKISSSLKGKPISDAHRKAMSEGRSALPSEVKSANIRKAHTPEVRARISEKLKGKVTSDVTKKKLAISNLTLREPKSNTGIKNIYFDEKSERYRVRINLGDTKINKSFSIKKYGITALEQAIKFCEETINNLIGVCNEDSRS